MKKQLLIVWSFLFIFGYGYGQISGIKTIPGTGPDEYPSLAAAISDLNLQGAGPGGVTFNIATDYSETFASATAGYITTLTGSSSNPIIFQRNGEGANPVITAAAGTGTMDAVISFAGCDYITFDGIDLQENPANLDATSRMEWGYALLKASDNEGSQNITIRNCRISLTLSYTATVGIYANNHTTLATTQLVPTSITGTNSYVKIYSNRIDNCYSGITLTGYADPVSPYTFYDQNNEIGKDGGNIITNVAGQTATPAVAGYGIYGKAQNNIKVANNTITSTMGGNGSPSAIYLTGASNGSYDITGNYVSMQFSGTGTVAMNGIFSDMGTTGTSNTMNIYNNTVTGCTYPTMTSGNAYFMSFANMGRTLNIYNNSVTNNSCGSSTVTATGAIRYLQCNTNATTIGPIEFHDNIISGNIRTQSVVGGGSTNMIYLSGKGTTLNMYNNQVTENILGSNGTAYGIYAGMDIGIQNVYDNLISNISKAEGATYGINGYSVTSGSGPNHFYRNTILNISGLTASAVIYGLYTGSSNPIYFYNNMVGDLRAPATNGSTGSPVRIYGLGIASSNPFVGFYNNTVYINNTSTGAICGTTCVWLNSTTPKLDLRNNILVNTSTPTGVGKACILMFSGVTTLSGYQSTSNYNCMYAGTPSLTNPIFWNGTTAYQSLADFTSVVYPRDLQSVTEFPPFVSTTAGSADLHLQNATPTQCEAGGFSTITPVSITNDLDSEPRFPNTGFPVNDAFSPNAPDIGADEFGGLANDLVGPAITYTAFLNTASTDNRILTATITDGTGVPTSGPGLPVLYWKINSGAYQAVQANWLSGNNYSFSFGAGVAVGDIVSYYIVAQDIAPTPNVACMPLNGATGYTANPPACSTPPVPPSSYTILPGISGVKHIGIGKDYETITAAAYDISTKVVNGPLTLLLDDASYPSETFPITFVSNVGSNATNTITLRPNEDQTVAIIASSATGILDLNGVDHFILDGSSKGTNTRDLTIQNTQMGLASYAIRFVNGGGSDPVTNVIVKNCIIRIKPVHASAGPSAITVPGSGGGHENVTFENNEISSTFDAFSLKGVSGNPILNWQIINNTIGSTIDSLSVTHIGVYTEYADNTLISNNEIMGPVNGSLNTGQTGVYIGNMSTNTKVRKNIIHTFWRSSDDGWGASGLWFATSNNSTVTEISNNVIYDIHSPGINPGVGQNITYGMFFRSGGNVKILHNNINLTGQMSFQYDASSACLGFYYQATGGNFEVRNNILKNSMTNIGAALTGKAYGIMISLAPSSLFSVIDNNDYFIDGYNGHIAQKYTNGMGIDADFQTLASWQTYTGQEANSKNVDPVFTSPTYLLPTTTLMNNAGSYSSLVTTDILGTSRSNPPDIGAYEFAADPVAVTAPANTISYSSATLPGMINASGFTVNSFFDYGTTAAYGNTIAGTPASITGSTNTVITANLSGLLPSTIYHFRARGVTTTGLTVYGDDMTFTTGDASLVTFILDMSTADGFVPGTDVVYIAGNFPGAVWNEPGTNPALMLTQVGSTLNYTLSMALPAGTYEYKYFRNAGWGGGEWAGGPNRTAVVSGNATINDTWGGAINWANLQWPGNGAINLGDSYDVYMQAYIPNGITAAPGQTFGLQAWIGYSSDNTDPSTWTNWMPAPFFGQAYDNDEFQANLGTAITTPGTYYYASRFQFGNMPPVYGGFSGGFWNGTTNVSGVLTVTAPVKTLSLNLLLESLHAGDGSMRKAQDESGDHFPGNTADQIVVELHDAANYSSTVFTASAVNLSTAGTATLEVPSSFSGDYFITIKHRNSITTVTAAPVSFSSASVSYSFGTPSQAYGNNMLQSGAYTLIFGGDANQDGLVDSSDMISTDNDVAGFVSGYVNTDANGDGLVDSSDMILIDNNASAFVSAVTP